MASPGGNSSIFVTLFLASLAFSSMMSSSSAAARRHLLQSAQFSVGMPGISSLIPTINNPQSNNDVSSSSLPTDDNNIPNLPEPNIPGNLPSSIPTTTLPQPNNNIAPLTADNNIPDLPKPNNIPTNLPSIPTRLRQPNNNIPTFPSNVPSLPTNYYIPNHHLNNPNTVLPQISFSFP